MTIRVHHFIPDYPNADKGYSACGMKLWIFSNGPPMDGFNSEALDERERVVNIKGGINYKVTCRACLKVLTPY